MVIVNMNMYPVKQLWSMNFSRTTYAIIQRTKLASTYYGKPNKIYENAREKTVTLEIFHMERKDDVEWAHQATDLNHFYETPPKD